MRENPALGKCEIGRYYLVTCVRLLGNDNPFWGNGWIPVIGPEHEDAEIIGFHSRHYHVDYRFLNTKALSRLYDHLAAHVLCVAHPHYGDYPHEISVRRLKCKREPIAFPGRGQGQWQDVLRDAYLDCPLKPGLVCPHRGIPLAGSVGEDGIAICPGHGLVWNTREMRIATDEEERAHRALLEVRK